MLKKNPAQDWPLRNDQIVLLVLSGASQAAAGRTFDISRQAVGKILNDPRAKDIIRQARQKLHDRILESMDDQLDLASKLSLVKLKQTLDADISPYHKAKSNQDRVALKILAGRGFLPGDSRTEEGGLLMSGDQFAKLVSAMSKSDQAKQIDPFKVEENEIIVEAEVVEEEGTGTDG